MCPSILSNVLLLFTIVVSSSTTDYEEPCPTWFYRSEEGTCECGDGLDGAVSCDNTTQEVRVLDCFCMTSNGDADNTTVVGRCLFNCVNQSGLMSDQILHPVTPNAADLDGMSCGYLHRKGRLCSECKENHFIPVYSFSFYCIECSDFSWVKYAAVAFIPLTGFYWLVLLFRLRVTSPKLNGFLLYAQFVSFPAVARLILQELINVNSEPLLLIARVVLAMYGVWNLDFFRSLLPPIYLKLSTLQILCLDYIIGAYPLALVVLTYIFIALHERDFRPVVWLWSPFRRLFIRFRRQWHFKTSIVDAFTSFILLSYVKLLTVSFDILIPTNVYNMNGTSEGLYLYYDPSVKYLGEEHLPYACLAILVLTVFILLPILLLLLYPMLWFQKCLSRCRVNTQLLRVFMECFQGCYRDGTDRDKDYRCFAALFLAVRPACFVLYALTLNSLLYCLAMLFYTVFGIVILICQPYKPQFSAYNKVDTAMLFLLTLICGGIVTHNIASIKDHRYTYFSSAIIVIASVLPLVYVSVLTLHWLYSRKQILVALREKIRMRWQAATLRRSVLPEQNEGIQEAQRLIRPVGSNAHLYT